MIFSHIFKMMCEKCVKNTILKDSNRLDKVDMTAF